MVSSQIALLTDQLNQLLTHLGTRPTAEPPAATPAPTAPVRSDPGQPPYLAPPEKFSGESGNCRAFLVQCELHFKHNPAHYSDDQSKIAFIISHLKARAADWATAEWSRGSEVCQSMALFRETFSRIFDHSSPARESAKKLMKLRQGGRQAVDYAIEFRTLAANSGWNTEALMDAYFNGLSDPIKDQLAPHELPQSLETLISMSIRTDNRIRDREAERRRARAPSDSYGRTRRIPRESSPPPRDSLPALPPSTSEEPMQLGGSRLSAEERRRRRQEGSCFYCGSSEHLMASCPSKDGAHQRRGGRW